MMNFPILYALGMLITLSSPGHTQCDRDTGLNTFQMIENHGYPCENHQITTEDDYILTYQRIPNNSSRSPVLLMHGSGGSSADYVSTGPGRGLAYILADLGYDVWLANMRGNFWSRNHTSLDAIEDAESFFDFSWHEVGYYDLPAAVDHILGVSGHDGLYFVGYSVGTTTFLVMASTRPEYNAKVKLASLMAPVGRIEHLSNLLLLIVAQYIEEIKNFLDAHETYEIPFVEQIQQFLASSCSGALFDAYKAAIFQIVGADEAQFDKAKVPVILSHLPSNAAMKFFYHLGQQIKNGGLSQYDYGRERNVEVYGTEVPPSYDLSEITTPVALYYARNDLIADVLDVNILRSLLSNVVNDYEVPYDRFNHIDFLWSIDVKDLIYDEIIRVINMH